MKDQTLKNLKIIIYENLKDVPIQKAHKSLDPVRNSTKKSVDFKKKSQEQAVAYNGVKIKENQAVKSKADPTFKSNKGEEKCYGDSKVNIHSAEDDDLMMYMWLQWWEKGRCYTFIMNSQFYI